MFIAGLDVGSSGCKIAVFDVDGNLKHIFSKSYSSNHADGKDEIDFNLIFASVLEVVKEANDNFDLAAIGITSFGESFVLLDDFDNILSTAMLYSDPRGKDEASLLKEKLGADKIAFITGVNPHEMYSLPKLMWIKNNYPKAFEKATKVLLCEDYIVYKLTGTRQIDYSLAQRTLFFDIEKKSFSNQLASASGINPSLFSKPVPPGTFAGIVNKEVASQLGLKNEIKVFNGALDQIANMIGAGIFSQDVAMDGSGTVECMCAVIDKPKDYAFYKSGFCAIPYINNKYATLAFSYGGCSLINAFQKNYAKFEVDYCEKHHLDFYSYLESKTPQTTNIFVLPYFLGAATPYMDVDIKGSVLNMGIDSSIPELYYALLESIAFELKLNVDTIKKYGVDPQVFKCTGGGSKSKKWVQLKADILGKKFEVSSAKEIGCAGTVILIGKEMGLFKSLEDGFRKIDKNHSISIPSSNNQDYFNTKYNKYIHIYSKIKEINL